MNGNAGVATASKQRVEEGLEALRIGLGPYITEHLRDRHGPQARRSSARGAASAGPACGARDRSLAAQNEPYELADTS